MRRPPEKGIVFLKITAQNLEDIQTFRDFVQDHFRITNASFCLENEGYDGYHTFLNLLLEEVGENG